jgi:hypothetical protein
MAKRQSLTTSKFTDWLIGILFELPWLELVAVVWKLMRHRWQGLADEGIYEVLEYESLLELKDKKGKRASFQKERRYVIGRIISLLIKIMPGVMGRY